MEYNTQRKALKITDYGRTVSRLIEYAKTLPSKEQRNKAAETIVNVMAQVNPKACETSDYRHKLWDHLMILSDFELDVDSPYPVTHEESIKFQPKSLRYKDNKITRRHYGKSVERMLEYIMHCPEGAERDELTLRVANYMKRDYVRWNRDTVSDDIIRDELREMSGGQLSLPEGIVLTPTQALVEDTVREQQLASGKKRKKKKR